MKTLLTLITFTLTLSCNTVQADHSAGTVVQTETHDDARDVLARIRHELGFLQGMVDEASRRPLVMPGRLRVNYTHLRYELELIRHGIYVVLHEPDTAPLDFVPLTGDYRE